MDNKNSYNKRKCACCGYFTIAEIKQTCPICYWEEDFYQEEHTSDSGGPNLVCLRDAKANYKTFGVVDKKFLEFVRQPLEEQK